MFESSLEFLRCVRCCSKLELNVLKSDKEILEGILECKKCNSKFPIVEKIPILWDNFSNYLSSRRKLGGQIYQLIENHTLKQFCKTSLSQIHQFEDDRTQLEERWSKIYQTSKSSIFYSQIKKNIDLTKKSNLVLEYGCSIGIMTSSLAESNRIVFGIDRSFAALRVAKKFCKNNLDYVVADFLSPVFGKLQFDLVLALNVLELVEPLKLLTHISKQISTGRFIISDPYDFERGMNSVKNPLDEKSLRMNLKKLGFKITSNTKSPSHITWNLKLNSRATLNYDVDLIIGEK
ncbi:methyltransferase domain-containing protein [Nitrosopumilus sp.]|uniref:methyltransferase domain-containing protein n=1 Tax=Nitrosopumilus sp. TaxID=2024843 RepID=UPI00247EAF34|nr:methyltransferase domain-containing protein [Nitrosopumilus sp.]MCV0431111.1 methyltransferase domain-containing protein [Nitrosopumilus sp.]